MFNFTMRDRKLYNADAGTGTGGDPTVAAGAAAAAGGGNASPPPPPAAAGGSNASPPPPPAAWTDSIQDAELREWSVNKGYNKFDPATAAPTIAQQYRSLEKLVGAEKAGRTLEIPDWDKPEAADAFFDRIGRPKDTKDYDFGKPPEGKKIDPAFDSWGRQTFHKLGLTGKQATALSGAYAEFATAKEAAALVEGTVKYETEDKALKTEWGSAYDNKIALASAAAKKFGFAPEAIEALQKAGGYGATMKMFTMIAAKLGEANFITGDAPGSDNMMTPVEATTEIKTLTANKDWVASFLDKGHPKHKEAVARMTFLSGKQVGVTTV